MDGEERYSNNKLIGLSVADNAECCGLKSLLSLDSLEELEERESEGLYSLLSTRFIAFFFAE